MPSKKPDIALLAAALALPLQSLGDFLQSSRANDPEHMKLLLQVAPDVNLAEIDMMLSVNVLPDHQPGQKDDHDCLSTTQRWCEAQNKCIGKTDGCKEDPHPDDPQHCSGATPTWCHGLNKCVAADEDCKKGPDGRGKVLFPLTDSDKAKLADGKEIRFSGTSWSDSTGWLFNYQSAEHEQYGRMLYKVDSVAGWGTSGYSHLTFFSVQNGAAAAAAGKPQEIRIADSVLDLSKKSTQYLVNIDTMNTLGKGEYNVATDYFDQAGHPQQGGNSHSVPSKWMPGPDNSTGEFACMEWHLDTKKQRIHMWVDGKETYSKVELAGKNKPRNNNTHGEEGNFSLPTTEPLNMNIGFYTYNLITVRGSFKDVLVKTTRVGCPGVLSAPPHDDPKAQCVTLRKKWCLASHVGGDARCIPKELECEPMTPQQEM
eukprot:TRINITY_DN39395_c1_g2_i6.p1 TRINITY_DN39395_c1_g2~~TRINITY_DN39395_c1_g2_i6.p1  ORF type:complete len:427 (-),score=55.01 TRINITY_DN39395_c1_g2_i6:199-1479(-)